MTVTRLWCLRHAESMDNVAGVLSSRVPGSDLTDRGRSQAVQAAGALHAEPVTGVYASPTLRTVRTAEPIADRFGLGVRVRPDLLEWGLGECEGRSDREALELCATVARAWILDKKLDARIPGGDSGQELAERCVAGLREIAAAHPGGSVVVVSHAVALAAALLAVCDNITADVIWGRPLAHATPFLLTYREPAWWCGTWPGGSVPDPGGAVLGADPPSP